MDLDWVGLSWLVRASHAFIFAFPSIATAVPGPLYPWTAPKEARPPASAGERQGGGALDPVGFVGYTPEKGVQGKEIEKDETETASKDGRMTSGRAATSPYVRLLRCLYSMQSLYLNQPDPGLLSRIRGLRGSLRVSPAARPRSRRPLSCNCFLSLMAFLQFPGVGR
jgi:hypothetical protein